VRALPKETQSRLLDGGAGGGGGRCGGGAGSESKVSSRRVRQLEAQAERKTRSVFLPPCVNT
jgi:hypothetical protein